VLARPNSPNWWPVRVGAPTNWRPAWFEVRHWIDAPGEFGQKAPAASVVPWCMGRDSASLLPPSGLRQRVLIGVPFGTALCETKQCLLKDLCECWGRGFTWKNWKIGILAQEKFRTFSILAIMNVNSVYRHKFNFTAGKVYSNSASRRIWKLCWLSHFVVFS